MSRARKCSFSCCVTAGFLFEPVPKYKQYFYCTISDKKEDIHKHQDKVKEGLKSYIEHNRIRLRDTEQKLKETGNVILRDIKETKDKVKERVGEIIEVCF